jgi:3-oxoacyl-[acyl-carrier-protein] synthase II
MGIISPIGLNLDENWQNALAGKPGAAPIASFDTTGFDVTFACEVKGFDPLKYLDRKEARRNDRFVQFALAATQEALAHSGLAITPENAERVGVIIGSGIGGIITLSEQFDVLREKGPNRISPFLVPMMIADMAAGRVSIAIGAKGTNFCTVSACSSGAHALGEAAESIRRGDVDVVIAGGAEAAICPIAVAGFASARALSTRNDEPERASRPFDVGRDGFVLGEGAGILVLEEFEHARERGATIYAELAGYGSTADAHHITLPAERGEGGRRAMQMAVRRAGMALDDIDYVNAHGTSTPAGDLYETQAIKDLFGDHAARMPVSSTKSMTGHLLGAAGAIEAIYTVQALVTGLVPPTINLDEQDPECDLDYVPNEARRTDPAAALSNSFGFGGHNVALLFRKAS